MWDQDEMHDILETDENFEIVASTIQCISTKLAVNVQRSNHMITYQPKDGRIQRKIRIENNKGDTAAHLWNRPTGAGISRLGTSVKVKLPPLSPDKKQREGGPWARQTVVWWQMVAAKLWVGLQQ